MSVMSLFLNVLWFLFGVCGWPWVGSSRPSCMYDHDHWLAVARAAYNFAVYTLLPFSQAAVSKRSQNLIRSLLPTRRQHHPGEENFPIRTSNWESMAAQRH